MILNLKRATACFFAAYLIVTILASATSITYGIVFHTPPPTPGQSVLQAEAFTATVPYHVLIMLIIWPLFAGLYFKPQKGGADLVKKETWSLAFFWLGAAMVTDLVCFVLIKNPYSLTFHEFYVLYQPWISLIYLAIFLSPWIRFGVSKLLN